MANLLVDSSMRSTIITAINAKVAVASKMMEATVGTILDPVAKQPGFLHKSNATLASQGLDNQTPIWYS